ncbi:MAG: hypothetical protein PUP93_15380, partial [Rhizonema sp. NSF051]|nr:hypothetical protein [Rhizonema sp. NSF051]
MTNHEEKSERLNIQEKAEQSEVSGSRYIFRGDDQYKDSSLGFEIGGKEAEEADIQTPWEHVSEKESYQTSRYISFSERIKISGTRGAAFFTLKNKIIKVAWDALKQLEREGIIKIYTPETVENLMLQQKRKVSKRATAIREEMEKNGEILIEGKIPKEILFI